MTITRIVEQIRDELAALDKACPNSLHMLNPRPAITCSDCQGTSRVFVLEGVREPCPGTEYADCGKGKATFFGRPEETWPDCLHCRGRSWVASSNPLLYLDAAWKLWSTAEQWQFLNQFWDAMEKTKNATTAIWRTLEAILLKPAGVQGWKEKP